MTDEPHDERTIDAAANAIEQRIRHLRATIRISLERLEPLEAVSLLVELLTEQIARFPNSDRAQMLTAVCDELTEAPDA
jgi:cell division protein ZapA (FtsZ GTPase activity inhibitor)